MPIDDSTDISVVVDLGLNRRNVSCRNLHCNRG
jgi:hypothetical protein